MFLNLWRINRGHFCSTRFHQMRITVESRCLQLVCTSSKFRGSCNLVLISLKVACSVKTNATWTIKNTTSSHYFSEKLKTNTLQGFKRYIKTFELEIICLLKYSRKNDVILLKNTSFLELQGLTELIFFLQNFNSVCSYYKNLLNGVSFFPTSLRLLRNEQLCRDKNYCSITS